MTRKICTRCMGVGKVSQAVPVDTKDLFMAAAPTRKVDVTCPECGGSGVRSCSDK